MGIDLLVNVAERVHSCLPMVPSVLTSVEEVKVYPFRTCQSLKFFLQGDDNRLSPVLDGHPSLVFTYGERKPPYTFTCSGRQQPSFYLLVFLSFFIYDLNPLPPAHSTSGPHPLLCMNYSEALLYRCYRHATACFIHTLVRQISPRLASSSAGLKGIGVRSAAWPSRLCLKGDPSF